MRIALSYPDVNRRGGIERLVTECLNHLHSRGHELELLVSRVEPELVPAGVRVHRVPTIRRPAALSMLQYRRRAQDALERIGAAVDVHASFGSQSPGGGVFWVPSVHRAALDMLLGRRGALARLPVRMNPDHLVRLRLEERHYRRRDYARIVACARTVKEDLMRYHGVPDEDIDVLPAGFRQSEFNSARRAELRPEARAQLGLAETERAVLFVANELERKGFGTLIEALARLAEPDVRLLVVGSVRPGPYEARIDRLGLSPKVTFVGPSDDVAFFYAAADVFALPTLYEPWGLVIVEALASGLPVVTTTLAGAAEAVKPGSSGYVLEDPEDPAALTEALQSLLAGAADSPEAISRSVAHLSWPSVLERYEGILASAAER